MPKPIVWIVVVAFGISAYVVGTRAQKTKDAAKRLTRG